MLIAHKMSLLALCPIFLGLPILPFYNAVWFRSPFGRLGLGHVSYAAAEKIQVLETSASGLLALLAKRLLHHLTTGIQHVRIVTELTQSWVAARYRHNQATQTRTLEAQTRFISVLVNTISHSTPTRY